MKMITDRNPTKIIKHRMVDTGITGADIARRIGVTKEAVNQNIANIPRLKSERIRRAICEILGLEYDELWNGG